MVLTRRAMLIAVGGTAAMAGCTGDDGTDDDDTMDSGDDGEPANATVKVRSHGDFGDILVGPDELTLYMFDADEQGADESACYDDCEANWPPLTVADEAVAGDGVEAELTTFERDDGSLQVAADGWPLYYFANDAEPDDVNGQGLNDVWWLVAPDGTSIHEEKATGGGGGY